MAQSYQTWAAFEECFEFVEPAELAEFEALWNCISNYCDALVWPTDCVQTSLFFECRDLWHNCIDCVPDCDGKECGDDGCETDCGPCSGCNVDCVANSCVFTGCDGKECGSNGCGGSCGSCGGICANGQCRDRSAGTVRLEGLKACRLAGFRLDARKPGADFACKTETVPPERSGLKA